MGLRELASYMCEATETLAGQWCRSKLWWGQERGREEVGLRYLATVNTNTSGEKLARSAGCSPWLYWLLVSSVAKSAEFEHRVGLCAPAACLLIIPAAFPPFLHLAPNVSALVVCGVKPK